MKKTIVILRPEALCPPSTCIAFPHSISTTITTNKATNVHVKITGARFNQNEDSQKKIRNGSYKRIHATSGKT